MVSKAEVSSVIHYCECLTLETSGAEVPYSGQFTFKFVSELPLQFVFVSFQRQTA